jgi:hypothetical protein
MERPIEEDNFDSSLKMLSSIWLFKILSIVSSVSKLWLKLNNKSESESWYLNNLTKF